MEACAHQQGQAGRAAWRQERGSGQKSCQKKLGGKFLLLSPFFFWFLSLVEKLEERAWRVDSCAWVSRVLVPTPHLIEGTSPTEPVLSSCLETPV